MVQMALSHDLYEASTVFIQLLAALDCKLHEMVFKK